MEIRYVSFMVFLAALCFGSIATTEVAAAQRLILNPSGNLSPEYFVEVPYNRSYEVRDFSGIWFRVGGAGGHGPEGTNPPLTPAGEERMQTFRPTRLTGDPADSNYPSLTCNPKGFPGIVVDRNHDHQELVQLPTRMLQIWQEERMLREIWMDGRALPSGDDYANIGPSWMGMSVGHWEGNTLVVETIGLDGRAWLSASGYPKSDAARFIERYTRTEENTLEVEMIMYDPAYYTEP